MDVERFGSFNTVNLCKKLYILVQKKFISQIKHSNFVAQQNFIDYSADPNLCSYRFKTL